jgi:hypothetical protein
MNLYFHLKISIDQNILEHQCLLQEYHGKYEQLNYIVTIIIQIDIYEQIIILNIQNMIINMTILGRSILQILSKCIPKMTIERKIIHGIAIQ